MWNFALMLMNLGSACGDLPVSQECLRQLQRLRNDAGVPDPSMSAWHMAILAALGVSTALIVLRKEAFGGLAMFAAAVGTGASFVLASDSYLHQFSETLGSPWATPPPPWMALPLALPAIGLYIVAAVLARRTMQQRAPFAVDAS